MTYRSIVFNPRPLTFDDCANDLDINMWTGFAITRDEVLNYTNWRLIEPILNHFRWTWAENDREYIHILGLFALWLQQPWTKSGVAICVGGEEGSGKSMPFVSIIGKIMGDNCFAHLQNMNDITGEYTSAMTNKLLVLVDECLFAGNHRDANIIKNFVTGDKDRNREMYCNPVYKESFKNFAFNSNNPHFVPAGGQARRFLVLESSVEKLMNYMKQQGLSSDPINYFNFLSTCIRRNDNEGLKTFANFLYNLPLDNFEPRSIPVTRGLIEQKVQTLEPFKKYWLDVLCKKSQIIAWTETGNEIHHPWLDEVPLRRMFLNYRDLFGKGKNIAKTEMEFWNFLQKEVPSSTVLARRTSDMVQNKGRGHEDIILFPSIEQCRDHFEKLVIGIKNKWEDEENGTNRVVDYRDPFPINFFGFNISEMVQEGNFKVLASRDWKDVDNRKLERPDDIRNFDDFYLNNWGK
jgi:hypothetical protein